MAFGIGITVITVPAFVHSTAISLPAVLTCYHLLRRMRTCGQSIVITLATEKIVCASFHSSLVSIRPKEVVSTCFHSFSILLATKVRALAILPVVNTLCCTPGAWVIS